MMHRHILLFSDGTGNSAGKLFRTNVWRLYKAVDLADPKNPRKPWQFAYYDDGVGTSSFRPLALLGGAIGVGLARNVRDLYAFVCRTYRPGDKIYAFGFSRGAFTVRVLVGLILNQGIVPYNGSEADLQRTVARAYRAYRRERFRWRWQLHVVVARWLRDLVIATWDKCVGRTPYNKHNNIHSVDGEALTVEFVGVWDTVAAYGLPFDELTRAVDYFLWPLSMPDQDLNPKVHRAMHALALDDERNTFHPQLWNEGRPPKSPGIPVPNDGRTPGTIEAERLSQVWFAGVHSDVGGGYPDDGLSYVSLEWMMTGAQNAGVRFCEELWRDYRALSDENGPIHDSRRGLGGYYRYNPRRIERLTHTKEVTIERIKIHESVLRRIQVGQDGYAPIVPPPDFDVVQIDGTVVRGQDYLKVPLGPASSYAVWREHVFNWVWWRRIAYFWTLFATLALVLAPLFWPSGVCASPLCFAAEWIHGLSFVLPGFAGTWTDTFASHPGIFLGIGVFILTGLSAGSWCEQRIRDTMRRVWYAMPATQPATPGQVFPDPVTPSAVNRAIQQLRTKAGYQYAFRLLTHRLLPTAFLLVVGYGALVLVTRLVFSMQDSAGAVCLASGSPQEVTPEPSHTDFKTNMLCNPTGLKLTAGGTYHLRFAIPVADPWLDAHIPAGPNGVHPACATLGMTAGVPLRRRLTQPWFKPMARIGTIGTDDYALDPTPSLPEGAICASQGTTRPLSPGDISFESEMVARSSGELFLYVNDAVFPPFFTHWFYRNNRGSARVTVQLVTTPPL